MDSEQAQPANLCHVVAVPFPGQGDINPLMDLCESLVSRSNTILITFVVTEEWLRLIGAEPKPSRIRFASIPNVLPPEKVRGGDILGFFQAVMTEMEAPIEQLLDRLEPPPSLLMADTALFWAVGLGNRRNIPVGSFFPMSATMFSVFQHFHLLEKNGHFPIDVSERGNERVEYIPGVTSTRLVDVLGHTGGTYDFFLEKLLQAFSMLSKSQYLLFSTVYELEQNAIDAIREEFSIPVYTLGPAISFQKLENIDEGLQTDKVDYLQWLDSRSENSVLYVSMGSHLSVSRPQMDEIMSGLHESGVRFMLVARSEAGGLKDACRGDKGLVVPWCDQLRVLSHKSIGGFWTHCGWNSIKEGILSGVPFLTFPLMADQTLNSKLVVEDWKVGRRVRKEVKKESLVKRHEIARIVKKFMDLEDDESREMRESAKELQKVFRHGIRKDGSSETNLSSFIKDITSIKRPETTFRHIVAVPYPGGGHINPLMSYCKSLVSRDDHILITLVLTEEWLGSVGSKSIHSRIRIASIPNPLTWKPSGPEDFKRYIEALLTSMEGPFERFLDRLEPSPNVIIADTLLVWAVGVGNRRNIPVASFWSISAASFSAYLHFPLLKQNGHFPIDLSEKGKERVDYIPGLSPTRLADLHFVYDGFYDYVLPKFPETFSSGSKAHYLLLSSIYELEQPVLDALKAQLSIPVYNTAVCKINNSIDASQTTDKEGYFQWLDDQPENSVLYVSLGVLAPVSPAQLDEIMSGLRESRVSFLMVGRNETDKLKEVCGDRGFLVPWCDQVKVLTHKSVGGFWSHCGWNSTVEGVLAGVPFLTLPLFGDQFMNARYIVEDWKTGWSVKKETEGLVTGEEIAEMVKRLMDFEDDDESRMMRERARELQKRVSRDKDGSFEKDISSFIKNIYSSELHV